MLSGWVSPAASRCLRALGALAIVCGATFVLGAGGCNAISGVGDLDFSSGGNGARGGASAGTHNITNSSASASTSGGNGGNGGNGASAGMGGSGGADCGVCDDPPGESDGCWELPGECVAGQCEYQAKLAEAPCDDGLTCTVGETCDGLGTCGGGEVCPAPLGDSCHTAGTCTGDECTYPNAPDGTSCGANAGDVCCSGTCVDITSNTSHCGGCGFNCASGEQCKSVATSNTCELAPPNTSGRCTCPGQNAKCPDGLVCRTQTPWDNLCSPASNQCPPGSTFQEVNFCPNYCFY